MGRDTNTHTTKKPAVTEALHVPKAHQQVIDALADCKEKRAEYNRTWRRLISMAKGLFEPGTYYSDLGNRVTLFTRANPPGVDREKAKQLIEEATGAEKIALTEFWQNIQTQTASTCVKVVGNVTDDKD